MKPVAPLTILPLLKKMHRIHLAQTISALVGGIILSLLGPMIVTVSFLIFSLSLILDHGFWGAYWIIAAVTLPIFFGIAAWLRGSVLEHAVRDDDSIGGVIMGRFIARVLIVVEVANIGPRLTLWAIGRLRDTWRVRQVRLGRIAQCVATLAAAHTSIDPTQLLFPGEAPEQLPLMMRFLIFHQIADLSKTGDRVWITSWFRGRLEKAA